MADPGRRRSAPTAQATSDVTRFRGVWIAAAIAAVAAAVTAVVTSGRATLTGSPGPLSRPHASARLQCASCHDAAGGPKRACVGCHGPHPSTRAGHRARADAGDLGCPRCHRIHRDDGGVVALGDGAGGAIRFGPGAEVAITADTAHRAAAPITVALVPVGACVACHDPDAAADPIAACTVAGQRELGAARPTVCFDEHRRVGAPDGSGRDAAWEVARAVAQIYPATPSQTSGSGPLAPVAVGLLAGLLALAVPRVSARMGARRRAAALASEAAAAIQPPTLRRLPTIDTTTCIGCHACIDACPYDVLELRRFVAVVARPADCCGLTLCEQRCPNGSLVMGDGEPIEGAVAVRASLESTEVPGLYLAGDVTGLPLIRNAINQGAHAIRELALSLQRDPRDGGESSGLGDADVLDVVIVGAGPAGLSAALAAKAAGLRYLVLEQATVAGSIQSFPRGKLVFDQPLELPLIGDLWLAESTKEELLGKWLRIVRREGLAIREGVRVVSAQRRGGAFAVDTVDADPDPDSDKNSDNHSGNSDADAAGHTFHARRLLVAVGRRGTPRPLPVPIPEAFADRVHYSLADARSFAGQRVLVVGLGDVAMEAAVGLSQQPGTEVWASYRGADFSRGKTRNIKEMQRRIESGAIRMAWRTEVSRIEPDGRVTLAPIESDGPSDPIRIAVDAVFVLIGSIPPTALLARFGLSVRTLTDTPADDTPTAAAIETPLLTDQTDIGAQT